MKFGTPNQWLFIWHWVLADKEIQFSPSNQGIFNCSYELWTSKKANSLEILHFQTEKLMKFGTSNQWTSNEIWQFHLFIWNWVLPDREFYMKCSPSNQGISNVHMKLWTSKQANSYEIWHFQTEKFIWKLAVSDETWHFQTRKFNRNLALPIREFQIGHFGSRNFIWNLALSKREFHLKFCIF